MVKWLRRPIGVFMKPKVDWRKNGMKYIITACKTIID
jgi:hypothetical protein